MMGVTVLQEAEAELWEAVAYYEDRAPGLGLDFVTETERSIQAVAEQPERWPIRSDGTRRYLVHRFPYLVVYAYESDHVWVLAIAHCKRRPAYWRHRTRPRPTVRSPVGTGDGQ